MIKSPACFVLQLMHHLVSQGVDKLPLSNRAAVDMNAVSCVVAANRAVRARRATIS